MGYAEAIEQQAGALRLLQAPEGLAQVHLRYETDHLDVNEVPHGNDPEAIRDTLSTVLATSEAFYVSGEIVGFLSGIATSMPQAQFQPADFPCHNGWIYLERPIDAGSGKMVRALNWSAVVLQAEPPAINFVALHLFVDDAATSAPWWVVLDFWTPRYGWHLSYNDGGLPWQFFAAFLAFVRQRVLTAAARPIPNRQARKRLAKALDHEPVVRVIELRRREYQQRDESAGTGVEYTCQWLVRGHWHQYHTKGGLQPRWVMPYVKGPSDKPLRVAEKVAYEVVR